MLKKIFIAFSFLGVISFAQEGDDWTAAESAESASAEMDGGVATEAPAPEVSPAAPAGDAATSTGVEVSSAKVQIDSAKLAPAAPKSRDVAVRYWVNGDSVELEAIFVKIEKDTVYLKKPTEKQMKRFARLADEANAELQRTNGQQVEEPEEDYDEEVEIKKDTSVIMTDEVKESVAAQSQETAEPVAEDDGSEDDLETALAKEDERKKMEEIAKVEEEIRQREIQDSIAADAANPFIKIYRLDLKRLYNLEDEVMIDLSLSDYVVPEIIEKEETIELYPAGSANLLVVSEPAACSLFVNGIPLKQVAPDTIKNIKPGKYTISVMQVLKDVEWWGSTVVRINKDSLNKVTIPVLRPSTRLTLNTDPEAVEVFVNEEPTEYIMPHYITDKVVENIQPQVGTTIYLRKVGYRDTSVTMEIKPYMPNLVNVEMTPVLDDLDFIQAQNEFNNRRSKHHMGRMMAFASIAPIVAGGVLWLLAERDWSQAADIKHAYNNLAAFESDDTKQMVKDNHRLNDNGDIKAVIGGGLGFVGIGLLTVGLIFAF
ncbi:MAG: hypothetical protein HUK19_00390 [Fibrobacter sp.]|nr:hypothetical protein [Fibrobacter sp.]